MSPNSARLLPLSTTGAVAAFKEQPIADASKSEKKKLKTPNNREDSLINRSSKPNVDELINAIMKSRHQLLSFENDESKFMATLKMKAIQGMTSV
jgi:hypothetical protein